MCSESCSQNAIHVDQECRLFRELDLKVPPDDERFNNIYKVSVHFFEGIYCTHLVFISFYVLQRGDKKVTKHLM